MRQRPVVVPQRVVGCEVYGFREVGDGLLKISVMVSLQTGVAPVHPGRRQFRVNLDRAFQVTEGQVKVALVLPLQVNRRPVHVHAGSSHAGVDSPLQVIQGQV